jgi:hypothetical protein
MKKAALLIVGLLISLPHIFGSSQQLGPEKLAAQVPTLDQILDRYVQALGGKTAIEKVNNRASRGTFTSVHLKTKGPIELYAKAPNKQLMVLLAQGFGNYRRGFNGTVAWEKYPGSDSAGNLSGFSKRDAEFYLPLKFREMYPNAALKGDAKLGELQAYLLEAPAAGNPRRWYFDRQSGLLLRSETTNSSGKVLESTDYGDYRVVDGVQEPFNIRLVDRDGTDFIIQLNEVKHNIPLDDASFDKPEKQSTAPPSATLSKAKPQVRFTSGSSATIPFVLDDDDNEILKVRVNDSPPLNFTIDTGSDFFGIITSEQAKNLNLTPRDSYKVGGIVGEIETASIRNINLSFPGLEARNQRLEILFEGTSANDSRVDGALGFQFLKQFVAEFDYEAKSIKLFSPADYRYDGPGESIPVKIKDGSPMIRVKMITASGKTVESYFEVDSGLGGTLVFFTPAVKKYGLLEDIKTIQSPTSIETGGEYHRRIGRVKSVQVGRFSIMGAPVSLSQNAEGHGIDGNVGAEILRHFKVIFDFPHHRMILEPNSHFKEPYEVDMSGISLTPEDNNGTKLFRIRQVVANTPASEAGVQADDLLTAIDGQPAANFTEGRIEHMFMQDGHEFALTIKRSEKVVQVRLKLRRLI